MDDQRIWSSEEGLWTDDAENYRATIDEQCLMVLPAKPFLVTGRRAAEAASDTPRWTEVALTDRQVARLQEGLIVIAYMARAEREGEQADEAHCTTVSRRLAHDKWRVIQHLQTPPLAGPGQARRASCLSRRGGETGWKMQEAVWFMRPAAAPWPTPGDPARSLNVAPLSCLLPLPTPIRLSEVAERRRTLSRKGRGMTDNRFALERSCNRRIPRHVAVPGGMGMRIGVRMGVVTAGLMAITAAAQSPHRLVVVVARPNDPRAAQQRAALDHDAAALRERDVVIQDVTPDVARRERPELGVEAQAAFEVLLVGKDGGVKMRRRTPVAASEITALIDTMPMRQHEMMR